MARRDKYAQLGRVVNHRLPEKKPAGLFFTFLVGVSALFVAGCAAFFSVRGIGLLFAGAQTATIIMAAALEFGKLMTASYLHRYWSQTTFLLKTYLTAAVLVLMAITSLGIYGFLSDAYEETRTQVELYEGKIQTLEAQNRDQLQLLSDSRQVVTKTEDKTTEAVQGFRTLYDEFIVTQAKRSEQIQGDLEALKTSQAQLVGEQRLMDAAVAELQTKKLGAFSSRESLLKKLAAAQQLDRKRIEEQLANIPTQLDRLQGLLADIEKENIQARKDFEARVDNYTQQSIEVEAPVDADKVHAIVEENRNSIAVYRDIIAGTDIGSFKFIARTFNMELDLVVKWFMASIVVVFDPLAICLVLAFNTALSSRAKQ